jgi:hypothetical protein
VVEPTVIESMIIVWGSPTVPVVVLVTESIANIAAGAAGANAAAAAIAVSNEMLRFFMIPFFGFVLA